MNHINPSIKSKLNTKKWEIKPLSYYLDGIIKKRDYYILSEGITLLESSVPEHRQLSLELLRVCYEHRTPSLRLGVTGSPGVGKSTFIDSIAGSFTAKGHHIGILTVDPSSSEGKGSILGDKTRMEELVKDRHIFIRPSPANNFLGGLNEHTYEAIILCEAAGLNRIFIETVGTGQSEVDVSRLTDITILLVLPGGGDSLQGIKKGIIEKADLLVINKSDGPSKDLSKISARDFHDALHFSTDKKSTEVLNYSSITGENKKELVQIIENIFQNKGETLHAIRKKQERIWLQSSIHQHISNITSAQLRELGINKKIDSSIESTSPFQVFQNLQNQILVHVHLKDID